MPEKTRLPEKAAKSSLPEVVKEEYLLLKSSPEDIGRAMKATSGRRVRVFDLERASLPGGKGKPSWVVTGGPEGEEFHDEITGIIIGIRDWRTWWKEAYGDGNKGPPSCASDDAIHGRGDRSVDGSDGYGVHDCLTCKWAQFGSDRRPKGGRGQDCSERRAIFLITQETIYPTLLVLPPTSIRPIDSYRMALEGRMKPLYLYEVTLGIEKDKNTDGVDFSKIILKRNRILSGSQLQRLEQMSSSFQATMSSSAAGEVNRDTVEK